MQYLLMIYNDEATDARRSKEELDAEMAAYWAFTNDIKESAVYKGGNALHPTSTQLRCVLETARWARRTVLSPKPKSNSAVITSSKRRTWTKLSNGLPGFRMQPSHRLKSGPSWTSVKPPQHNN